MPAYKKVVIPNVKNDFLGQNDALSYYDDDYSFLVCRN